MGQRADRVGHLLQRELSELVRELKDPRVQAATLVTLTAVRVSDDMSVARVMVSVIDPEPRRVIAAIGRAQGHLHGQLARRLQMKKLPELRFQLDDTEERASHIDQLLRQVVAEPPVGEAVPLDGAAAAEEPEGDVPDPDPARSR